MIICGQPKIRSLAGKRDDYTQRALQPAVNHFILEQVGVFLPRWEVARLSSTTDLFKNETEWSD